MDTPTTSAAPASAPSAAPAAAAPSSAPVSSPASPASPAVAAPPAAAAPAAPSAPRTEQQIREGMRAKIEKSVTEIQAAKAAAKQTLDAPAEDADETDGEGMVFPAEGDEAADETDPAAEGQTEDAPAEEEGLEDDPFAPVVTGPLAPRDLQAKLKEIPELAALLEKHPDLKNSLFAASRLAQRTAQYDSVVGSPEEAKAAVENATQFAGISQKFSAVRDEQTFQEAMSGLVSLSALLDDDGQPIKNERGQVVTDGTVGRLIEQSGSAFLKYWGGHAEQTGDVELDEAVQVLKARAFGGPASAQEGLTEEQQRAQESLTQERERLNQERQSIEVTKQQEFDSKINTRVEDVTTKAIESRLAKVNLDGSDKAELQRRITEKLYQTISDNPQYQRELDGLLRRQSRSQKTVDDRVSLANRWVNTLLPTIARAEFVAMGEKLQSRTQDKKASQAARAKASRSEPAASMGHARPLQMTTDQLQAKVKGELNKKLGREPSMTEMMRGLREARGR